MNNVKNIDHYRFAIANERNATMTSNAMSLALLGVCDPIPLGLIDEYLALKIRLDYPSFTALKQFFLDSIRNIFENPPNVTHDNILPTPAIYAEALLGDCQVGEDFAVRQAEADVRAATAKADFDALKAERLRRRLAADLLDPAPKHYEVTLNESIREEVDVSGKDGEQQG